MMASDTPPSHELAPETVERIRTALDGSFRGGASSVGLQDVLRVAADEARAKEIPAERLLIVLKHLWSDLPGLQSVKSPTERTRLQQQIITSCIKEYFRD